MRSLAEQKAETLTVCIILVFSVLLQSGVLGYLTGTTAGTNTRPRAMAEGDQMSGNRTGRSLQGLLGFLAGFRLGHSLTSAAYGTGLNEIPNYSALYDYLPYAPVYSSQHIVLPHLPFVYPVGMRPSTPSPHDREQEVSINETQTLNGGHRENTKEPSDGGEELITNKLLQLDNNKNHSAINDSLSDKKDSMTDRSDKMQNDDLQASVEDISNVTEENTTAVSLETNETKLLELRADDDKNDEKYPNINRTENYPIITTTMDRPNETISTIDMTPTNVPPLSNSNFTWSYYPYYGKPTGNENISITTDSTDTMQDGDFTTFSKYFDSLSPPLTNSIDDNAFSKPARSHGFSPVLSDFFDERNYVRGSYNYLQNQAHDKSRVYWG